MIKNILISLLLLAMLTNCESNKNDINNLSDEDFINIISKNHNSSEKIATIDSLLNNSTLSKHKLAIAYFNKGSYLMVSRKYIESIAYINKSLSLFKDENNETYIGRSYNILASDNINLNKEAKALEQINIALDVFKKTKDKKNEVVAFDVLARLYYRDANYTKALEILKKSLKIYTSLNLKEQKFATFNNIGSIYKKVKDYNNAVLYFNKAIKLNDKYNYLNSNPLQELGILYLENNELEKCIDLHTKALEIQNKTGHLAIQKQIYNVLIDSIKGKKLKPSNIISKYFNNLPNYITKRDSVVLLIDSQKVEERIKSIESQYILQTKKSELNQEIKLNNKNKWMFTFVIILLLFLGLFLIQKYRNKQLKLNHDKLVLEQKVLRSQMNPHFIFNALTSIQKNLLDEDILKSSTSLSRFAKLIRQNFNFINKKFITLGEELDMLKNYIETQQMRFEDKFEYKINVQENLDISYIKIPPMLLQPFVENAIEHGLKPLKKDGELTINITNKLDSIHFEIIDNGIGFEHKEQHDREHSNEVFFKRLSLRDLNEEQSFVIEPSLENGKGTKVSFSLNL